MDVAARAFTFCFSNLRHWKNSRIFGAILLHSGTHDVRINIDIVAGLVNSPRSERGSAWSTKARTPRGNFLKSKSRSRRSDSKPESFSLRIILHRTSVSDSVCLTGYMHMNQLFAFIQPDFHGRLTGPFNQRCSPSMIAVGELQTEIVALISRMRLKETYLAAIHQASLPPRHDDITISVSTGPLKIMRDSKYVG